MAMDKFQEILDLINRKIGGIGSVITALFWMIVLFFAIKHMLLDF